MSQRLVERISRVVDRRARRRGFLRSSAMAATAMAVAPVAYALRPTTAEAAIVTCKGWRCNSGALCCDGYHEFCCLITGENVCPPGTIVAGWWKVDGSGFCDLDGPRPRYFLDCNLACDPSCGCDSSGLCRRGCTGANCRCPGGCDIRRVECTRFRYGQCNQDTCVGELACRIVTCVPPWRWDPACATSPVLTDPETLEHDRPCLHEGFTDIPPKALYAQAVEWMAQSGVASGVTDDLFAPDAPVSRAEFAVFLWRYSLLWDYAGRPATASVGDFLDVAEDLPFSVAIDWMVAMGVTTGVSPGSFDPDGQVSRAEAVVFLHRLAATPAVAARLSFSDVDDDAWYRPALAWAVKRGVVAASPQRAFMPERPASRGDVAMMLHGYHLREPEPVKPQERQGILVVADAAGPSLGTSGEGVPSAASPSP